MKLSIQKIWVGSSIVILGLAISSIILHPSITPSVQTVYAAPECNTIETDVGPVARVDVKIFHYYDCPSTPGVDHAGANLSALEVGCTIVLDATGKNSSGEPTAYVGDPAWSCTGAVDFSNNCMNPRVRPTGPGQVTCTVMLDGVSGQVSFTVPQSAAPPIPTPSLPPIDEVPPTTPPPQVTFGPTPSSLSPPSVNDPDFTGTRYCAVNNQCICGSENDEKCTETAYCVLNSGACTRVDQKDCKASAPLSSGFQPPAPKVEDFGGLVSELFTWSISILGLALFVVILYAGFEWLTAAGNPGQISKAKGRIRNAILGSILLLSSYIILNFINPDLVGGAVNLPIINPPSQQPLVTPLPFVAC